MTDEVRNRIQGLRYVRAAELARVGYVDAVIARETPAGLVLVDGHLRADLAADAEIPVLVVDIDEGEAAEVLATLDPLAAAAGADETALAELLAGLPDDDGLDELLGGIHDLPATIGEDPSPAEEPLGSPPEPRSERGQVWQLGPHRVMCGDSTVPEHVAGLLDGAEPECILTDPPYNSGADRLAGSKGTTATTNRRVANDELSSRGYVALLKQAFGACPSPVVVELPRLHGHLSIGPTREVYRGGKSGAVSAGVPERLVELARAGRSPGSLAREFEPSEQTIRNWVRQAELDEGARSDGLTTEARRKMSRLQRENKRLRMERDILKKAAAWFAQESGSIPGGGTRS
ncbi:transposase [Candidatus Palauibacter sp.]|uniref:transposase n=1 Tax=Candidatus Palauibacter sp. TaxID=3101350 RepID=UPI003CC60DE4